jgi:hypothetical protein
LVDQRLGGLNQRILQQGLMLDQRIHGAQQRKHPLSTVIDSLMFDDSPSVLV